MGPRAARSIDFPLRRIQLSSEEMMQGKRATTPGPRTVCIDINNINNCIAFICVTPSCMYVLVMYVLILKSAVIEKPARLLPHSFLLRSLCNSAALLIKTYSACSLLTPRASLTAWFFRWRTQLRSDGGGG